MASKLKKLWWLMLVFAVCNIAIALILFFGNKQKSPEESIKPIPQKNVLVFCNPKACLNRIKW